MIEPVLFFAVISKGKDDGLRVANALSQLMREDKTLRTKVDPDSGKLLVLGIGELHLDAIRRRLRRDFGVLSEFGPYEVFCRETIRTRLREEAKYIREHEGRRQFAHCVLEFEPLAKREGFEFVSAVKQGEISARHAAAVEKGAHDALQNGLLAGYPIVGVRAILVGGESRDGESDEMSFKIAGGMALRSGCGKADPVVLAPIMKCEVMVPEKYLDAVVGDLNGRRAKILEITGTGLKRVKCTAPLSAMLGYAGAVLAITDNTATFVMNPSHFEEIGKDSPPGTV
ncbi:MAG: hypothetical protein HYX59_05305 [Elusimicrobia bacterium]|nr:hypothetical protein [Elusimicrobiota bacterium]